MYKLIWALLLLPLLGACAGPLDGVKSHLPAGLSCDRTDEFAAKAKSVLMSIVEPLPELRALADRASVKLGEAKAAAELACAIAKARNDLSGDYLDASLALVGVGITDPSFTSAKRKLDSIRHAISGAQDAAEELGL